MLFFVSNKIPHLDDIHYREKHYKFTSFQLYSKPYPSSIQILEGKAFKITPFKDKRNIDDFECYSLRLNQSFGTTLTLQFIRISR
jgi:hypothetical protein